jgi:4-diphosphocytidyl-2-C-methyl-D-erythritol kinase
MSPSPHLKIQRQCPAKINLSLHIKGRRADGFHELETTMVKVALFDELELQWLGEGSSKILCHCSDATLPVDEGNLAVRALLLLNRELGAGHDWSLSLTKRIPHGAGLGGGSSNAGAALVAGNQALGNPLPEGRLLQLAAELGSDVPFFVLPQTAAQARGRGEVLQPVPFPWRLELLLIKPPFGVPTPWAYQHWAQAPQWPQHPRAAEPQAWGAAVNDLENPVFAKHRLLPALKSLLLDRPEVATAMMSGSGSTIVAVLREGLAPAEALQQSLRAFCGEQSLVVSCQTL